MESPLSLTDAHKVADYYSNIARDRYDADGGIRTIVAAVGPKSMVAYPTSGDALAELTQRMVWASGAEYIALVSEAWVREYPDDGQEHPRPSAVRDVDPLVESAVVVTVFDVNDLDVIVTMSSIPRLDDEGQSHWFEYVRDGAGAGKVTDAMRWVFEHPWPWPPPAEDELPRIADDLIEAGVAVDMYVG